jgi:hypothetical protein
MLLQPNISILGGGQMLLLSLLFACATDPVVSSVSPDDVRAGDVLTILGEGFDDSTTVKVSSDGTEYTLAPVTFHGVISLGATLPEVMPAGNYGLTVTSGGRSAQLPSAFKVIQTTAEVPCGGHYSANAQMSLARKEFVIERFFDSGPMKDKSEVVRIPFVDVAQVEFERLKMESGNTCTVVFIKNKNGTRVMFDDDEKIDLQIRANQIALELNKPIRVTRDDSASAN